MAALRTSKDIYSQILWDPGFEQDRFFIGYDDRERGTVEIRLTSFEPEGDIPWHRIQYFRCGESIVWDRRTRTDLTSDYRSGAQH